MGELTFIELEPEAAEPAGRGPMEHAEKPGAGESGPDGEAAEPSGFGGFVYDGVRANEAIRAGLSRRPAALRPLPMEDVCFYIKPIDNSDLQREADSREKGAWLRFVAGGLLVLMAVIGLYGPKAWMRQSGYRIEELESRHQALAEINRQLRVREAQLSNLSRVAEYASRMGLEAPPPERVAWQDLTIPPSSETTELAESLPPPAH